MATRRDPSQVPYIALRAKVTRAKNRLDPDILVKVAEEVVDYFNAHFWPDNWPSWRNDLADPLYKIALTCPSYDVPVRMAQYNRVLDLFGY